MMSPEDFPAKKARAAAGGEDLEMLPRVERLTGGILGFDLIPSVDDDVLLGFGIGVKRRAVLEPLDKAAQQRKRMKINIRERKQVDQIELESLAVKLEGETLSEKMDSQHDGSFPSLLRNEDTHDEASDPNVVVSPNPNEVCLATRKAHRTKNFSRDEDILLVSAWINTSNDAVTGCEQQSSSFWSRVYVYYVNNKGTQVGRTLSSLRSRWFDINTACAKFVGYLSHVERRERSGRTEKGKLLDAREMYASFVGKQFHFGHCWEILKLEQKWTETLSTKQQKNGSDVSPVSSSHATPQLVCLGDDSEASTNLDSPLNASRKQLKNESNKDGTQDSITDQRWQEKVELKRAKAERQERALAQHEIALAQHQRALDLEEKRMELQVMQTDTSGMDRTSAEYWNNLKLEILAKTGINL